MSGTPASAQQAMSGECGPAQADAQMGFAAKPRRERNKTKAERSGPRRRRRKKKKKKEAFAAMNPGRLPEQRLGMNSYVQFQSETPHFYAPDTSTAAHGYRFPVRPPIATMSGSELPFFPVLPYLPGSGYDRPTALERAAPEIVSPMIESDGVSFALSVHLGVSDQPFAELGGGSAAKSNASVTSGRSMFGTPAFADNKGLTIQNGTISSAPSSAPTAEVETVVQTIQAPPEPKPEISSSMSPPKSPSESHAATLHPQKANHAMFKIDQGRLAAFERQKWSQWVMQATEDERRRRIEENNNEEVLERLKRQEWARQASAAEQKRVIQEKAITSIEDTPWFQKMTHQELDSTR